VAVGGFPVVVSSPSGAGKTTLVNSLVKKVPGLRRVVTCTSRPPRPGEKNGRDYHFLSPAEFERSIKAGKMVEWANVHGRYYGIAKKSLDEVVSAGENPVLVIDVQGAKTVLRKYPESALVFVLPPSWGELEKRLRLRGDTNSDAASRLRTARLEVCEIAAYGYAVVNDSVEEAVSDLAAIIRAERLRTGRQLKQLRARWLAKEKR